MLSIKKESLKELEATKKAGYNALFEKWRNAEEEDRLKNPQYIKDIEESYNQYQDAWDAALKRLGLDETAADASWKKLSASLPVTLEKLSLRSSAEGADRFHPEGPLTTENNSSATQTRPSSALETTISIAPDIYNLAH